MLRALLARTPSDTASDDSGASPGRRLVASVSVKLLAASMLLACSSSSTDKSTGSNWLACAVDADCAPVSGSACADDGYCVDTAGDHVTDPAASGGSSAGGSSAGGSAAAGTGGATGGGAASGGATGGGGGAGSGCTVGGTSYQTGATFPASDGCNTCTCDSDGMVACTEMACPPPQDGGPLSCTTLESERAAELNVIQSCTSDADCGQVLIGTSCGCTRNLVARNDADVTTFQDIMSKMADNGCDTGTSTCDCPEANGFACQAGKCTWNYTTPSCPPECFRAIQCVQTCGDTPQDYGCCPCPTGWIDTIQCP